MIHRPSNSLFVVAGVGAFLAAIAGCGGSGSGGGSTTGTPVASLAYGQPVAIPIPLHAEGGGVSAYSSDNRLVGAFGLGDVTNAAYWSSPTSQPVVLQGLANGYTALANGVNNKGQVVGSSSPTINGIKTAIVWTNPSAAPSPLPVPATTIASAATSINDKGVIVGWITTTSTNTVRFVLWSSPTAKTYTLLPGVPSSNHQLPKFITNSGKVITGYVQARQDASIWSSTTSATPIDLAAIGGSSQESVPLAVNNSGVIVGGSVKKSFPIGEMDQPPTIWVPPSYQPTTPPLDSQSYDLSHASLNGVNDAGAYVGTLPDQNMHGNTYVWLPGKTNTALNSLLPAGAQAFGTYPSTPVAILNDYSILTVLEIDDAAGHFLSKTTYYIPVKK
ncbi:MAG TPA: hypothetical protein VG944_01240 [Fimbriimonas sp.]|nr:hypothetical protein [Fimbriimonas sp.]